MIASVSELLKYGHCCVKKQDIIVFAVAGFQQQNLVVVLAPKAV